MSILYRPARAEDLQRAGELVAASINELCGRHGFGPMAAVRPPMFSRFSLEDDPDGLWVAEDAGKILGFAFSWACGDLWFLAQLFVSPDRQGHGIGPALLHVLSRWSALARLCRNLECPTESSVSDSQSRRTNSRSPV